MRSTLRWLLLSGIRPGSTDDVLSAAVREWPTWWQRVLHRPADRWLLPGLPGWDRLSDLTASTRLAEQHHDAFWAWTQTIDTLEQNADDEGDGREGRDGAAWLTGYVNALGARLGRPVRPFVLHLRALPLRGDKGWVVDDQQVVLSLRLLHDQAALERLLKPVLLRVA